MSFSTKGKLLWKEKASKDGWSETDATNGVLDKIRKKLLPRIGSPGLPLKQENSDLITGSMRCGRDWLTRFNANIDGYQSTKTC